jgi:hypothetical protein
VKLVSRSAKGKGGPVLVGCVLFDPFYNSRSSVLQLDSVMDGASKRWTDSGLNRVFITAGTDILMGSADCGSGFLS